MKYGFCTGFASEKPFAIEPDMLPAIKEAGYDFVEFPVMSIEALEEYGFGQLKKQLEALDLDCTSMCNLFPGWFSPYRESDKQKIEEYLEHALTRASSLGTVKVVFGSGAFRTPPQGMSQDEAVRGLAAFCSSTLAPVCIRHQIKVLIEPLCAQECPVINSVCDGAGLVRKVNSNAVGLMADFCHMQVNCEDPRALLENKDIIEHIHVSNPERGVPAKGFDSYVKTCLEMLRQEGYDDTISFETKNSSDIASPLALIRKIFD